MVALHMHGENDRIHYESDETIEDLLSALNDEDYQVREKAARTLATTEDDKTVIDLLESLKYHDWHSNDIILRNKRMSSAEALGIIKDKRSIPYLIKSLTEDRDGEVRAKAAWALGEMNALESTAFLTMTLYDDDWRVRASSANSLGVIGDSSALIHLFQLLDDENEVVRQNALVALVETGDNTTVNILLEYLCDKEDEIIRQGLIIFEKMGKKAVDPLKKALKNKDWRVRAIAVEALGHIGGETSQKALIGVLQGWLKKDDNYFVRAKAAEVLGIKGDENALKPLKKAYEDDQELVRYNAYQSLKQIVKNINKSEIWNFDNGEISFDFTRNWEIIGTENPKKVVKGQYGNNTITLSITKNEKVEDISVEEFSQMIKQVFEFQETQLIDERDFYIGEMECYILIGENQSVAPTEIIIILFKKGDLLYYMWFAGDPLALNDDADDINLMVKSFYIYS